MSNSRRFTDAYNRTDKALRMRFGFKPTMTYTDCVRRAAAINSVVRRFEDDLLDYGRLRNAIVHRSNSAMTIAEPHDDVTERFERIADILETPPLASKVCHRAETVRHDAPLKKAVEFMTEHGYSNVPVVRGNAIIGIITNRSALGFISAHLGGLDSALDSARVEDALEDGDRYYAIMRDAPVDEVLGRFEGNRRLNMIIITDDGTDSSAIIGVITTGDLVTISKMLEVF